MNSHFVLCQFENLYFENNALKMACVETEAILRALFSKHKFSNWHKTKWLFVCFSFMTNKQIKNACVDFFNVLKFSRFIAQPRSLIKIIFSNEIIVIIMIIKSQ